MPAVSCTAWNNSVQRQTGSTTTTHAGVITSCW